MRFSNLGILALALGLSALAAEETPRAAGTLILDESCYWRYYIEFAPERIDSAALKADGEKILGKPMLDRLEKQTKVYFKPPYVGKDVTRDWSKTDWRDEAVVPFSCTQGFDDRVNTLHVRTPPPAARWMAPEFDDAGWARERLPAIAGDLSQQPMGYGQFGYLSPVNDPAMYALYLRTTFLVPAEAAGAEYSLGLGYSGGARVFINGQEVKRGHLPAGELGPDATAEIYPPEAYKLLEDEMPAGEYKKAANEGSGVAFCGDLRGKFEDEAVKSTAKDSAGLEYWRGLINRKGWDRLREARNRRLAPIAVPRGLLKQGVNVLAVEIRTSRLNPITGIRQAGWSHHRLHELALRSASPAASSALKRPKGIQVWVEDIHRRCYSRDFASPGTALGTLRFVGAANGSYAAQICVGTDRELTDLRVVPGELRAADGKAILPAASVRVSYGVPHPVGTLVKLGQDRCFAEHMKDPLCPAAETALQRYVSPQARAWPREQRLKAAEELNFFDHLSPAAPARVPADSCQTLWLTLNVPPEAAPGIYKGSVRVECPGTEAVAVPVEAEIHGWRVPDSQDFQTVSALEQSPFGVAKQYGAALWSDEHFRLLEASFRELSRVGNDWLFIPVIHSTEFGNKTDSLIRWTRKKDGSLEFDFKIMKRYLELATKHLGKSRVISFVVAKGGGGYDSPEPAFVTVFDEQDGKEKVQDLSLRSATYREDWKQFALAAHACMQSMGLEKSMYWGYSWDMLFEATLPRMLSQLLPEVKWTRGCHGGAGLGGTASDWFRANATIWAVPLSIDSRQGWKNPYIDILLPRGGSSIMGSNGYSPPFAFRLMTDRALVSGLNGIGRLGADYWQDSYFQGRPHPAYAPGMPCVAMLWPGKDGAEPSARFEVFREALQETEVRIYLEQALERGGLPEELSRDLASVLREHNRETMYVGAGYATIQTHEYCTGWQERSRRLYRAAETVTKRTGLDAGVSTLAAEIPAGQKGKATLRLRNWTARPRSWRIEAGQSWIVPERAEGKTAGQEDVVLTLDGRALKSGEKPMGELVLIDVDSGIKSNVKITSSVVPPLKLVAEAYDLGADGFLGYYGSLGAGARVEDYLNINVPAGREETRFLCLASRCGESVEWKAETPEPWLVLAPAAGTLKPFETIILKVTVRPPDTTAKTYTTALVVNCGSGGFAPTLKTIVHVMPPYQAPAALPAGESVNLNTVPKTMIKSHRARHCYGPSANGNSDPKAPDFGPVFDKNNSINGAVEQTTVYNLEGGGFTGFSAKAKLCKGGAHVGNDEPDWRQVNFEVYVDGVLRAQSGLVNAKDEARLLSVENLAGAKEFKLHVRFDVPEAKNLLGMPAFQWIEPKFYKAGK